MCKIQRKCEFSAGKVVMHDPFAMRPFFGYNVGDYMQHWLDMEKVPNAKLPKIFHVNWFRKDNKGQFIWPGFGENSRVLDWIVRRVSGEESAVKTPVGYLPKPGSINIDGLTDNIDMEELFHLPRSFWQREASEIRKYFEEQINKDLPDEIWAQLSALEHRFNNI